MSATSRRGPCIFVLGNLSGDYIEDVVYIDGRPLKPMLSPLCLFVLRVLAWHQGSTLTREQIAKNVGRHNIKSLKSVAVTISQLRKALEKAGWDGEIKTVVGSGYTISKAKVEDNSRVRSVT